MSIWLPGLLVGLALLLFGQKLFWLFVGGFGFLVGVYLAQRLLPGQPSWTMLAAGLVVGLAGAVLTILIQRFAVGIAGFVAGGYIATSLAPAAGLATAMAADKPPTWVVFLAGGLLGALLLFLLFDWALIVLSCIVGAATIVQNAGSALAASVAGPILAAPGWAEPLASSEALWVLVFAALVILGILFQASLRRRR